MNIFHVDYLNLHGYMSRSWFEYSTKLQKNDLLHFQKSEIRTFRPRPDADGPGLFGKTRHSRTHCEPFRVKLSRRLSFPRRASSNSQPGAKRTSCLQQTETGFGWVPNDAGRCGTLSLAYPYRRLGYPEINHKRTRKVVTHGDDHNIYVGFRERRTVYSCSGHKHDSMV